MERSAALGLGGAPTSASPVSRTALVRRARRVDRLLAQAYPDARCELDFTSPLELLVATILSAQSTDRRVNAVTPALFARYPDAAAYAAADRGGAEDLIRPTGFFRSKAAALTGLGQRLCDDFGGEVPGRLEDLVTSARRRAQDRGTWCSATRSACRASRSTPTSAGWRGGSAGPTRPTPSRPSTRSARCSRAATGRSGRTG